MAGVTLTITETTEEVQKAFAKVLRRLKNLKPAMKIIGETVRTSIVRNFEESGRPEKWAPLSPTTLKRRKGKNTAPLIVKGFAGGMVGSINYRAGDDWVIVGTNKIQAAVHQFGAKKGEFGTTSRGAPIPWGDIPARPFMMVQDEDWTEIADAINDYLAAQ